MGREYSVIVADPPWRFGDRLPGPGRGAAKHYGCLDTDALSAFTLPPLADDAILLLWRVSAMPEEALRVCRAWGFVPKSEIVWVKKTSTGARHFGMGHYVRAEHETCIVAARGRGSRVIKLRNVQSTFEAPVGRHSEKPESFYGMVETWLEGPYVELFARRKRQGWDCIGNEIDGNLAHMSDADNLCRRMQVRFQDFHGASTLLAGDDLAPRWKELEDALTALPVYLKPSKQKGKGGDAVFDPVATNGAIKARLATLGWTTNPAIPEIVAAFGTDVDYFHSGFIVEAQFSHYAFLVNNLSRSAVFAKSKTSIGGGLVTIVGIVAKAHMFPSANSTLYYEQGIRQLTDLEKHGLVHIPIRMIGLFAAIGVHVPAVWTEYRASYGRDAARSTSGTCVFKAGMRADSRCNVKFIP